MLRCSVIDIRGTPSKDSIMSIPEFGPAFEALWNGTHVTCKTTGNTISDLPRPTAVIFSVSIFSAPRIMNAHRPTQLVLYASGQAVRTIAGKKCAVVMFLPPSAISMLRLAPEELGGMGDIRAKIEARVTAGEDLIEAANKVRMCVYR
jgi:alkanesulfonate monooxygenase SsuD/methylene tetrahydromethanopterin reductase-like flavin-dependent oxidoreductase (luciferase family)